MKPGPAHGRATTQEVAPFTGARIETSESGLHIQTSAVAPFTGARIETARVGQKPLSHVGRPLHGGAD